jgi:hypothetical protein
MKKEAATLHTAAMELATQAFSLENDSPQSRDLFQRALDKERKAADLWDQASGLEPTRSILYRSAASLAWNCQDYAETERLAKKGLEGDPPGDIAWELEELLDLSHPADPTLEAPQASHPPRRQRSLSRK